MNANKKMREIGIVLPLIERGQDDDVISWLTGLCSSLSCHRISILYPSGTESVDWWRQQTETLGVALQEIPCNFWPSQYLQFPHLTRSYDAYLYLKKSHFDALHFADRYGAAYYTLLAKRQGLGFDSTEMHVHCVGTMTNRNEERSHLTFDLQDLILEFIEKGAVEFAKEQPAEIPEPQCNRPLVSVCITHFNRPEFLKQAIHSIERQDYPSLEVVLVDDGSQTDEAKAYLDELDPLFRERGWKLIRQKNSWLGAARNTAARHARGEYLLIMDHDNYADPTEISQLMRVAQRTGADIVTCAMKVFSGHEIPQPQSQPMGYNIPYLSAAHIGLYYHCFGDANSLVKRSAYFQVGGFCEERGYGATDHEFFSRCVLSGLHLETVPEPLYWYRVGPDRMSQMVQYEHRLKPIRAYKDLLNPSLQSVALFSHGVNERKAEFDELHTVYRLMSENHDQARSTITSRLSNIQSSLEALMENIEEGRDIISSLQDIVHHSGPSPMRESGDAYHLDRILGSNWQHGDREVELNQNQVVTLEGWALDLNRRTVNEVSLVLEDGTLICGLYGLLRSDVAIHFGVSDIQNCGFKITLDCSLLKSQCYKARLQVTAKDQSSSYESASFIIIVKEPRVRCSRRHDATRQECIISP